MSESVQPRRIIIDGESWEVAERDGRYHFTWVSGADPGYGFTSVVGGQQAALSREEMEASIREFMESVNPDTGHLD